MLILTIEITCTPRSTIRKYEANFYCVHNQSPKFARSIFYLVKFALPVLIFNFHAHDTAFLSHVIIDWMYVPSPYIEHRIEYKTNMLIIIISMNPLQKNLLLNIIAKKVCDISN